MKITSEHAAKRIAQISQLCLNIFDEQEKEAIQEAKEAAEAGLSLEPKPVVIVSTDLESLYWKYHRLIEFYSKFL